MKTCPTCLREYASDQSVCADDGAVLLSAGGRVGELVGGRYRLLGEIGRGAMGTVYRGYQLDRDRPVAVKILHKHLSASHEFRRRFEREAAAVAALSHTNIVSLYAAGVTSDGAPYLVMEYIDGVPLDELFGGTPLPVGRALDIVRQVAAALSAAHEAGVVHRDLKLANLMLSERVGLGDSVKVVDFGVAKLMPGTKGASLALTRLGAVYGTPEYASPEQAQGLNIDTRSDIYSLGVVLFRLLTGRLPFENRGMAALVAHIAEPPPRLSELRPEIPDNVAAIVERCMAKEAEGRYQSADELIIAIDTARLLKRKSAPRQSVLESAANVQTMHVRRPFHHEPAASSSVWPGLALMLCLFTGAFSFWAALGPAHSADAHGSALVSARPGPVQPAPAAMPELLGQRRQVVATGGGTTLRADIPLEARVGEPVVFAIEAWDDFGRAAATLLTGRVVGLGSHVELSLEGAAHSGFLWSTTSFEEPGRYRVVIVADELDTELGVYIDVAPAPNS